MIPLAVAGPSLEDLSKCVHCGLCLQHCPTYAATGLETESPRGRLYLMRAHQEGRVEPTERFLSHIDLCLQCRNCEAVCPSGVPYGRIMQAERAQLLPQRRLPWNERLLRWLVFRRLLPNPAALRLLAGGLRWYQRSGLQRLVRGSEILRLFPSALAQMEAMLPPVAKRFFAAGATISPKGEAKGKVALLSGCVMPYLYPDVHEATVRVLARNGYMVVTPEAQLCCGALHTHSGEVEGARELARHNIDVFLASGVEAVIVNAAGCGATLKEYHELLHDDPAYREKAERFSSMVYDINEFLAQRELQGPLGALPLRVTYQDSCHLAHAQRITQAPRALMAAIPELELVEMHLPDHCCGSAGVYNITQREMAGQLLESKVADIADTGAKVVATANPGCMLQISLGMRQADYAGQAVHVVQLLDWAYAAAEESAAATGKQ